MEASAAPVPTPAMSGVSLDDDKDSLVRLLSMDGQEFQIPKESALQSRYLRDIIEQDPTSTEAIPLPSISARGLALVLEYLNKSRHDPIKKILRPLKSGLLVDSGVPEWAETFIRAIDLKDILDIVETATVLRIKMYVLG